jgi:Protein of unknown function (DUF3455)
MKNCNATASQTARRFLLIACASALAVGLMVPLSQAAHARYVTTLPDRITPPPMPFNIQVDLEANKPFLVGHATGTQNYICLPAGGGFKFALFTPQATLFNDDNKELITHYFSPNPAEGGIIRATWQNSRDTSKFWGSAGPNDSSTDQNFVAPGAVAWVKLTFAGSEVGPTGGDALTGTTFVQRVNTAGGVAPALGCASSADVGHEEFVPYRADYIFYKKRD